MTHRLANPRVHARPAPPSTSRVVVVVKMPLKVEALGVSVIVGVKMEVWFMMLVRV